MEALKSESWRQIPKPWGRASQEPAAHLHTAAPGRRRSGDQWYREDLMAAVEVPPRTPRPQSCVEGSQTDGWLQQLERMQGRCAVGSVRQQQAPAFSDRTVSMPTLPDEAAASALHSGYPSFYGGGCTPSRTPSLYESSLGSVESLTAPLGPRTENAHIKVGPRAQQARLCSLAPARIDWLPIQRRVVVNDPGHARHPDNSTCQVKFKPPITPIFAKNPVKLNGFGDLARGGERGHAGSGAVGLRTWQLRGQSSSTILQTSREESRASAESASDPALCWQTLGREWADRGTASQRGGLHSDDLSWKVPPQRRASVPLSSHPHAAPVGAAATATAKPTGFSSITISSRRVSCAASLPGSKPPAGHEARALGPMATKNQLPADANTAPVTFRRKAIVVKVTEHRVTTSPASQAGETQHGVAPTGVDPLLGYSGHELVVLRRKATVVKVTEHVQSYSGVSGASRARPGFRHSYSEGLLQPASSPHAIAPSPSRLESVRDDPISALGVHPPPSASVERRELQGSGAKLHRSTLSLYLSSPASTESRAGCGRPRRPASCYASVSGSTEPSSNAVTLQQRSQVLPQNTNIDPESTSICSSNRQSSSGAASAYSDSAHPGAELPKRGLSTLHAVLGGQPLALIKTQGNTLQPTPDAILARNAAAVIANIKLQRQLSKKKMSNGTSAEEKKSSGQTSVEDVGSHTRPQTDPGPVTQDPADTGRGERVTRPHVEFIPLIANAEQQETILKAPTLREALELHRPDLVSRSQGRVRALAQQARERRALQVVDAAPECAQGPRRRHCTRPSALSDNLFKPRDRAITGKEMQLRSRRNYNNLPEMKRKKEEEKKKVCQSNRLRAERFKKKLLDQILQRGSD